MFLLTLVCAPANAHVALDTPNGGETLEPGSVFTVVWHDVVTHGPANYDLWYSLTGDNGPWIELVADINPPPLVGGYTYDWTVPDAPSAQVRVMVVQDNSDPGADYDDTGGLRDGTESLTAVHPESPMALRSDKTRK